MTNKLGLRNRNDALYHQILKEKEPKIFYIRDYDRLRTEIKKFPENFSLMKNLKSFSMPRKSIIKEDFLGLKSPMARPQGIEHDFKIKEKRIKNNKGIDARDVEYNILLFTTDYGVDSRLYPTTLDEYLEENKDIELG